MTDADAPAAFFKRSKSKNLRTRAAPSSNQSVKDGESVEASPSTLASKLKKQLKERKKPKARLSFGGDEEEGSEEVFHVRKLKLGSSLSLGLPDNLDQATLEPEQSSVRYSKEYLQELKASTSSAPPSQQIISTQDFHSSLDSSELAGAIIVDDELVSETVPEIPSESSVVAAREKRERLRQQKKQTSGEEEFISLTVARREDTYQGPHPESRLVREEDELGEGDDEYAEYTAAQERIALGKKAKKREAVSKRTAMQEMIEDADEEDEETVEWEKEQLRRGGRMELEAQNQPAAKLEYIPTPIPPLTPLPSLDAAISRLSQSLTELTTSHAASTASMMNLADERHALEGKEKEMRTMVEKAEMKRSWFNAFREWVETVAIFLDEKYPLVEKFEDEHVSLLRERSDMILKRRLQDDEDDLSLFFGTPPTSASEKTEEVDDLGRIIPGQNPIAAHRERRTYRTARHSRRQPTKEEEGYSTDSSLALSDETDFQTAMSNLRTKISSILQDVKSNEFRDPRHGLAKWFGAWREKYPDSYNNAFGGLGMVSAWEFWVRLEILGWNPIEVPRALDSFSWFESLYDYSHLRAHSSEEDMDKDEDEEPDLGPDGDLVSAMISTAVVPRLYKVIQGGAFDAYSAKHIRILIDLAEQVEASVTQDKFELFIKAVIIPFRESVDSSLIALQPYLDYNNAKFDPESVPARRRFLIRRYKLLNNLLQWRKYIGEKFGIGELISKLIGECMLPVAENGWDVGGEEIMLKVRKLLPPELISTIPRSGLMQM